MKLPINSIYLFWSALALPALPMILSLTQGGDVHDLLHPSGEFAARFMIIAMMLSPLRMLFPKAGLIRWLMTRRRALGVAAFCYAALHTVFYVIDSETLSLMIVQFPLTGYWTGWLAFAIFIPLALTSNQMMVRLLKKNWKTIQRFVYPAAVLTLMHWIFVENNIGPALVHFIPLALLESYRIYQHQTRHRHSA